MMRMRYGQTWALCCGLVAMAHWCIAGDLVDRGAPGVLLRIYDIGVNVHALPDLAPGELPNDARIIRTLDLDGGRGDFGEFAERFVTEVTGFLNVTQAGTYTFRLISDDGSRLWIDGRVVVDHDGPHGPSPKDGEFELRAGQHPFRVLHFEAGGGERLALLWRTPDAAADEFVIIPPAVLTHDKAASRATAPGTKRIIPPLRRGRPGDGAPVSGLNPGFTILDEPAAPGEMVSLKPEAIGLIGPPPGPMPRPPFAWLPADGATEIGTIRPMRLPGWGMCVLVSVDESVWRIAGDMWQGLFGQGCVFRHSNAVAADLARLGPAAEPAFEMKRIRARANGVEIEFTKALDPRAGWEADAYHVEQWPFDVKGQVGPTRDGRTTPVKAAGVSADRRTVSLEVDGLKPGHVVYIRLLPPCLSEAGELPWSTEAWYTLNEIPPTGDVTVPPRPAQPPQNILTDAQRSAGWRLLFDGQTTRGWRGYRKDAFPDGWQVVDGCLVRVGPGGDIITNEQFDSFELELEWRISAGGNSGIFYRVDEQRGWPWETGPEMQVLDNGEHADGQNAKTSAGSNYALHAPLRDVTQPVGLFNQARVRIADDHVEHWLNGVKVVEYQLGTPQWEALVAGSKFAAWPDYGRVKKGYIVLQDHGDKVWFRNIRIRPLPQD